jgi:hypothetical protein
MKVKPTLLPIDECEEWIWEILDSTKDSSFEYIKDEGKEFLIFNTNDFKCSNSRCSSSNRSVPPPELPV